MPYFTIKDTVRHGGTLPAADSDTTENIPVPASVADGDTVLFLVAPGAQTTLQPQDPHTRLSPTTAASTVAVFVWNVGAGASRDDVPFRVVHTANGGAYPSWFYNVSGYWQVDVLVLSSTLSLAARAGVSWFVATQTSALVSASNSGSSPQSASANGTLSLTPSAPSVAPGVVSEWLATWWLLANATAATVSSTAPNPFPVLSGVAYTDATAPAALEGPTSYDSAGEYQDEAGMPGSGLYTFQAGDSRNTWTLAATKDGAISGAVSSAGTGTGTPDPLTASASARGTAYKLYVVNIPRYGQLKIYRTRPLKRLNLLQVNSSGALDLHRYNDAIPEAVEDTVAIEASGVTGVDARCRADGRIDLFYCQDSDVKHRISEDAGATFGMADTITTGYTWVVHQAHEPTGMAITMLNDGSSWYISAGTLGDDGATWTWSAPAQVFADAADAPGTLHRRSDNVWEFAYIDSGGNALMARCRNLQPDGTGTWV